MSNRNLMILGLAAAVMVAWAVIQANLANKPISRAAVPSYLIQGLDPDQIASITIGTGRDQVILTRRRTDFLVTSKDNYPAKTDEINKLISSCLDIQTTELYSDNPANFKDLGVDEETARNVVKFYKADSSLLTGVVISQPKEQGRGTYVRQITDNRVYLTTEPVWIKSQSMDYIDQLLTNVTGENIKSVTVSYPDETYVLRSVEGRDLTKGGSVGDDKKITLDNPPEGKKLKENVADRVFTALANLRFDDVNTESSQMHLKFDRRYICRLNDSTVYTFWLAKENDRWFAKCDAEFEDKTPVTKTQGEVESEEQLKEKEAKLLARDAAEEFSDIHKGWVYRLLTYRAENLVKPLSELVEDLPPEEKQKAPAEEPNETAETEPPVEPNSVEG